MVSIKYVTLEDKEFWFGLFCRGKMEQMKCRRKIIKKRVKKTYNLLAGLAVNVGG